MPKQKVIPQSCCDCESKPDASSFINGRLFRRCCKHWAAYYLLRTTEQMSQAEAFAE